MYDCVVQGIETPSTFVYLAEMFHIEDIGFLQKLVAVAVAGSKITTDPEGVFGTFPWYWIHTMLPSMRELDVLSRLL